MLEKQGPRIATNYELSSKSAEIWKQISRKKITKDRPDSAKNPSKNGILGPKIVKIGQVVDSKGRVVENSVNMPAIC